MANPQRHGRGQRSTPGKPMEKVFRPSFSWGATNVAPNATNVAPNAAFSALAATIARVMQHELRRLSLVRGVPSLVCEERTPGHGLLRHAVYGMASTSQARGGTQPRRKNAERHSGRLGTRRWFKQPSGSAAT
jgi:hypothetical protein